MMKIHRVRCLIFLLVLMSERSFSQTHWDTLRSGRDMLSVLPLKHKQYKQDEYKILQLRDLDSEGNQIKSTWRIAVSRAGKIVSSFSLPIPDEEVKNFSVNEISETPQGFKIAVAWGGGNYFYNRTFYFIFRNDQFYFNSLSGSDYTHEPERETKINKTINPPVSIDKFDIRSILKMNKIENGFRRGFAD